MAKAIESLSAGELAKAIDKAEALESVQNDAAIAAGMGNHRFTDMQREANAGNPVAVAFIRAWEAADALRTERKRRREWHGTDRPVKRAANPRPRKYASAAERQAAFRNRWATVEVRLLPEQVATLDSIADEGWDGSRGALLYAMVSFALTNHNWRNPTFSVQAPTMRSMKASGDYSIQTVYDRESKTWTATLRDAQMNIVAKPKTGVKRTELVGLTWEDFEPYKV